MQPSPLTIVRERFKDKASLVKAVEKLATDDLWNDRRLNSEKGLARVSNAKLLHLHDVLSAVKEKFGSRAKLIDAIAAQENRAKDADYLSGFEALSTPSLFDRYNAGATRAKHAAKKPPAAAKPAKAKKRAKKKSK